ncbi:hypothetical protein Cni_G22310 [Canna indica]|uniref:Uncharacterized protein n=1 Tax=Canna indica TaxID=4628 RepID=A0AAQ3KRP5_9LILI|nr:hypothetical protein Cni_G22310 [Canna indica]
MEKTDRPPPAVPSSAPNQAEAMTGEASHTRNKKNMADLVEEFRNSDYYKLRLLVKNLRPLFVEAIWTPDLQSSSVAHDILNQMNIMIELTKKIRGDVVSSKECEKLSEVESTSKVKKKEPSKIALENEKLKAQHEAIHALTVENEKLKA